MDIHVFKFSLSNCIIGANDKPFGKIMEKYNPNCSECTVNILELTNNKCLSTWGFPSILNITWPKPSNFSPHECSNFAIGLWSCFPQLPTKYLVHKCQEQEYQHWNWDLKKVLIFKATRMLFPSLMCPFLTSTTKLSLEFISSQKLQFLEYVRNPVCQTLKS